MHNYLRLLQYARRQRASLIRIFGLTLAAAALVALQPWPMKLLIDHVLGPAPLPVALENGLHALNLSLTPRSLLLVLVFGGLALFTLNSAVDAALTWAWIAAGRRIVYDLAQDLFARLQRR